MNIVYLVHNIILIMLVLFLLITANVYYVG